MNRIVFEVSTPWARDAADVVAALGADASRGLSRQEVVRRLAAHGPNTLRQVRKRSVWLILVAQFRSLLIALLCAALVAAMLFGEWIEAGTIGAVIVINAALGFVTELRAVRSMEALRKMAATGARVRREGEIAVVAAADLVPGDVVLLEGGDVVTADIRIIEASRLQANESALTGESVPSGKSVRAVPKDAAIGDRETMLFKGTVVTRGTATGLVVATGMDTELGRITRLVEEASEEHTPLERRLNSLGQGLVWVTLVIALLVAGAGYAAGQDLYLIIETAIALAVAAVPEGLPVIATIALARGMHRMARENALVNRLSAVETLGATSVICTDKTGTLTENRMHVHELLTGPEADERRRALEVAVLCNNAELGGDDPDGTGDPMEVALLRAGRDEGIDRASMLQSWPQVREVAFDPDLMMMASIHRAGDVYRVAVKGAPEQVVAASRQSPQDKARWIAESERLAGEGLRVLALAEKTLPAPSVDVYAELDLLGLVAMHDPPREEVGATLKACHQAGIRVVMVTGDHPVTARNIARATGLVDDDGVEVILGQEIGEPETLDVVQRERLVNAPVFARVNPKQKLDLIALHQQAGSIVAMTGDGVNDAPALRKADIGVAMGARGTGAAREAAAMVLKDDDLSTLEVAIAEGRTIFDNIRNFVVYLLSCNISEILVVAIAAAAALPLPLLPLHILFLNLVTDVFPALALGVGEGAEERMRRPPRPADEPVVAARHWQAILAYGVVLTGSVLAAFMIALANPAISDESAVTVSFLTLAFAQLWHVFNMRRDHGGLLDNEITRNSWIWGALALCVAILLAAVYVEPLARLLSLHPPSAEAWLLVLGMSLVPLVVGQVAMTARALWNSRQPRSRTVC